MIPLSEQERHNLAMNYVGKYLEDQGYEFLGVNSQLKKNPQFVTLKDKKTSFVVVRAVPFPAHEEDYDPAFMNKMKSHAEKFNAKIYYAGVGLADTAHDDMPIHHDREYKLNFTGLVEI